MNNNLSKRLKILFIPSYSIYPTDGGSSVAQLAYIEELQHLMDVSIIVGPSNVSKVNIEKLKKKLPQVMFLCYGYDNHKKENKASIIHLLKKVKRRLEYIYNRFVHSESAEMLDNLLYIPRFFEPLDLEYVEEVLKIIKQNSFDIIQTELLDSGRLIDVLSSNVCKIFVHHEIKWERMVSQLNTSGYVQQPYWSYLTQYTRRVETSLLSAYDAVFCFTENDSRKIQEFTNLNVYTSPFPVSDSEFVDCNCINNTVDKLIFLGAERHYPNKEGIEWFIKEAWGTIKKHHPNLKLYIVGEWSRESVKKYKKDESLIFTGFINNVNDIAKDCLWIVPIRIGAGLRTKILTGMAKGSPVISTSFAAEGICAANLREIFIANSSIEFIETIHKLINQPDLAKKVGENGKIYIKNNFSQRHLARERFKLYKRILSKKALDSKTAITVNKESI